MVLLELIIPILLQIGFKENKNCRQNRQNAKSSFLKVSFTKGQFENTLKKAFWTFCFEIYFCWNSPKKSFFVVRQEDQIEGTQRSDLWYRDPLESNRLHFGEIWVWPCRHERLFRHLHRPPTTSTSIETSANSLTDTSGSTCERYFTFKRRLKAIDFLKIAHSSQTPCCMA